MQIALSYHFAFVSTLWIPPRTILTRLYSKYSLNCYNDRPTLWRFTPSPTWMSCQAVAIDIHRERSKGEKAATEKKWEEEANEEEMQQKRDRVRKQREWNGEDTKWGAIIQLVVSFSNVRECEKSENREWWQGKRRRMSSLPVSAQSRVVSYTHTPTHPLNAST